MHSTQQLSKILSQQYTLYSNNMQTMK